MSERTTSSNWALGIVQALEMGGVDCRMIFRELGLDYAALEDPDARFAQDGMTRLWQRAVELSGNPAIGLNMAKVVRPASFHVVGYALMSSRTLTEGLARLVRYQRIIAEGADLSFRPTAKGYELILAIHGDRLPPARQSAEASMACSLAFCRWLTGQPIRPQQVLFQGDPPADLEPFQQVFQAPLKFNAGHYALLFERADLDRPLPTANESLAQLRPTDLLIVPPLKGYTAADFDKAAQLIDIGEQSVLQQEERLRPYQMTPTDYEAWKSAVQLRRQRMPRLRNVVMDKTRWVNARVLQSFLDVRANQLLDTTALHQRIDALETFRRETE